MKSFALLSYAVLALVMRAPISALAFIQHHYFRFQYQANNLQAEPSDAAVGGATATTSSSAFSQSPPPGFVSGPSLEDKPDYDTIHGPLGKAIDGLFLRIFRLRMAEKVGVDSDRPYDDYQGLMELTAALNARYSDREQVKAIAQDVLRSLFPSWLPTQFAILFSKPFPAFSARMNAWATWWAGTWLMGECEINDCEIDGGGIGRNQGLLVKRCRFLEEAGCASVCVNSCKQPTQSFFNEDMGLPLTMTPDYDTHECQFSFGLTPTEQSELDAKDTPCLSRCPTNGSMRRWHSGEGEFASTALASTPTNKCSLMDEESEQ